MEKTIQDKEMTTAQVNHEFYYTLARLQFVAIKNVAHGENDNDKCKRAMSLIKQLQKIIKKVENGDEQPPPPPCLPPCKLDRNTLWCNCPHKKVFGGTVGQFDDEVSTQM